MKKVALISLLFWFLCSGYTFAQRAPTISAIFPAGGQVGQTVEISVRGSDLDGAHTLIVSGSRGVTGELFSAGGKVDTTYKSLFEDTCAQCHELRSPRNRSMTPSQWEAVVDRMISEKGAPINSSDRDNILVYLKSAARASGGLTAQLQIEPDAVLGRREIRVVGKHGGSTAFPCEIDCQTETIDAEPNDLITDAVRANPPIIINGIIKQNGDQDYFSFLAKAGDRYIFNIKAYRLDNSSQQFFNPTIILFSEKGEELAHSNGFYAFDPLIDYVFQTEGVYYLCIRDLLYRGSPACVYRLTMGNLPYNTYLFPTGGQLGSVIESTIGGTNLTKAPWQIDLTNETEGLKQIDTPYGVFPFIVSKVTSLVEADINIQDKLFSSVGATDAEAEILFQTKCVQCHEPRSPSNRPLTADDWAVTIQRMGEKQNSDISPSEAARIITFFNSEITRLSQLTASRIQLAQRIEVPVAVSGRISQPGEVDYYRFTIPEAKTLDDWWVIHPFDNPDESGFDIAYSPEKEINLEQEYIGKNNCKLKWYKTTGSGESAFSNVPEDDVIGYALTYIDSETERTEILSLGSDDGIKVWVNDQLIWSNFVHRALAPAQDVIALPLKKGSNKLLIKISNGWGPWGFLALIGGYAIELTAEAIGSPLSPSLTLLDVQGQVLQNNAGIGGTRNARIDYSFRNVGDYAVRIEDATESAGVAYTYHLSISPAAPDFAITVTPANPNVGRKGTRLLTVTATRRVGFTGDIEILVESLPDGVIAGVILKDMTQGFITLTAAGDAQLGYRVVNIIGRVKTAGNHYLRRVATPIEIYRI
ncbi:MAG: hypothetical protein VCF25_28170 [Candidatus Poribacteria bacterium]